MKNFSASVIFALIFFASTIVANASFHDVSADHANSTAIEFVQNENIVAGYSDGNFRPDATINRAELTKIIIEAQFSASEIENCALENNSFPDVQNSDWFAKYICVAKNKNIVSGYSDGTFRPADPVNFAEASKIISGAFGFETGENEIWFKPFVDELGKRSAIPTSITSFEKNISRGEMAEMIWRLKSGEEGAGSVDYLGIAGTGKVRRASADECDQACFEEKFAECETATTTFQLAVNLIYFYEIIGPKNGLCEVKSKFLANPNPDVVGKEMICEYDNSKDFETAVQDMSSCKGELFDFMNSTTSSEEEDVCPEGSIFNGWSVIIHENGDEGKNPICLIDEQDILPDCEGCASGKQIGKIEFTEPENEIFFYDCYFNSACKDGYTCEDQACVAE